MRERFVRFTISMTREMTLCVRSGKGVRLPISMIGTINISYGDQMSSGHEFVLVVSLDSSKDFYV